MSGTREREVEYAEMELRLRRMILELLEPTIKKTRKLDMVMSEIREGEQVIVADLTKLRTDVHVVQEQVLVLDQIPTMFTEEAQKRAELKHELFQRDEKIQTNLRDFLVGSTRGDDLLEERFAALEQERLSAQQTVNNGLKDLERRLEAQGLLFQSICEEKQTHIGVIEEKQENMYEHVFGEGGLAVKLHQDAREVRMQMDRLQRGFQALTNQEERVAALESHLVVSDQDFATAKGKLDTLDADTRRELKQLKESIQAATNQMAIHTATFVKEQRQDYQAELCEHEKVRSHVLQFIRESTKSREELRAEINGIKSRTDETGRLMRADLSNIMTNHEEEQRKREAEAQTTNAMASKALKNCGTVADSLAHMSSILKVLLESMKMSTRLEDDIHRRSTLPEKMKEELPIGLDGYANLKQLRSNLLQQVHQALQEGPRKKLPPVADARKTTTPR